MTLKNTSHSVITACSFLAPGQIYAAPTTAPGSSASNGQIINPVIGNMGNNVSAAQDGSLFLNYAIMLWRTGITIGALVVIAFFVMGAFEWLSSGADSKGAEKAKNRITNAVIGLIILVTSITLVGLIGELFLGDEFNILQLTLPTAE